MKTAPRVCRLPLTVKISYCNELAQFCRLKNIDYEQVRRVATMDTRIGESHTKIPGPDELTGFGGKCFPKDTKSLFYEMRKAGMGAPVLNAVLQRNREEDRPSLS